MNTPTTTTHKEREIEDLGTFGVWWYRRPTGHTKTGARHRGETPLMTEWAYALKSGGSWEVGRAVSGFKTRDAAISAGRAAEFRRVNSHRNGMGVHC